MCQEVLGACPFNTGFPSLTRSSPDPSLRGKGEKERLKEEEAKQVLLKLCCLGRERKEKTGMNGQEPATWLIRSPSQQPAWAPRSQCGGLMRLGVRSACNPRAKVEGQQVPMPGLARGLLAQINLPSLPPFVPSIWLYLPLPLNPKPLSPFPSPRSKANSRTQKHSGHYQSDGYTHTHTPKSTATLPLQGQSSSQKAKCRDIKWSPSPRLPAPSS